MTTIKRGCTLVTKEDIDKIVDEKTADEIVKEMLRNTKFGHGRTLIDVNWLPLAALHSFIYCLYPVKNDKDWIENLQRANIRVDAAYEKISAILFLLEKRNILVSAGSKKWKSKDLGFQRVNVHRIVSKGKESQFLLNGGEFREFKSLADAIDFVKQFQTCYSILAAGISGHEDMPLAITVNTVVKLLTIKAISEIKIKG